MKFVKLLFGLIYFAGLLILMAFVSFVIVWCVTVQADNDSAKILIWNTDNEEDANLASYESAFTFWGDELAGNFTMPTKYRTRNWVSWDWYKSMMTPVDVAVDAVVSVVSPLILPISNINMVSDYYIPETAVNGFKYSEELDKADNDKVDFSITIEWITANKEEFINMNGGEEIFIAELNLALTQYVSIDVVEDYGIENWIEDNPNAYESIFWLSKYNNLESDGTKIYEPYFNRLINPVTREINTSTYLLYVIIYFNIFICTWITFQYPAHRLLQEKLSKESKKEKKSK